MASSQTVTPKALFNLPTAVSPQAASLIKFIEYPMDYARGLANINIPLYTIKVNDIEIPIGLKYHGSGIKVFDQSGWVGAGWSLTAEPNVVRSIQGTKDEKGFLDNDQLGSNDKDYLERLSRGILTDELPDQFYYSLLDKSGSFFFSRRPGVTGYTIKTLPYEPIQITRLGDNPVQFLQFKIVDEKGRQYFFGGDQREYTNLGDHTAWKGTKIISSNLLDTVSFKYYPAKEEPIIKAQSHYLTIDDMGSENFTEKTEDVVCDGGGVLIAPDEQFPKPLVIKHVNGSLYKYLYDKIQGKLVLYKQTDDYNQEEAYKMQVLYTNEIKFRGGASRF